MIHCVFITRMIDVRFADSQEGELMETLSALEETFARSRVHSRECRAKFVCRAHLDPRPSAVSSIVGCVDLYAMIWTISINACYYDRKLNGKEMRRAARAMLEWGSWRNLQGFLAAAARGRDKGTCRLYDRLCPD